MQYLLIRNARLALPDGDTKTHNILVADGRIVSIGNGLLYPMTNTEDYDAHGLYVIPSLINMVNPRPQRLDDETVKNMNFEHLTAGITTIMTVSPEVEDNIAEMSNLPISTLNFAVHIPLRQVVVSETRRLRKIMILHGTSTAVVRFGEEKRVDIASLGAHIAAARSLGLRVLYDFTALLDPEERITILSDLCELLQQDRSNRAYILGVEHEEELSMLVNLRGTCDVLAHISYDPFGQSATYLKKLSPQTIAEVLRGGRWCSLGLAYSTRRAMKEGWPDMTPEIVGRNTLSIIAALGCDPRLTMSEVVEFAISRPAQFVGLRPVLGQVTEGSSANFLVWDDTAEISTPIDTPRGNIQEINLRGSIEAVVLNGRMVVDERFKEEAIAGRQFYSRIV